MNQEIVDMARQACAPEWWDASAHGWHMGLDLVRFAALVAEREREACAQLCEDIEDEYRRNEGGKYPELKSDAQTGASDCAAAIRARSSHG